MRTIREQMSQFMGCKASPELLAEMEKYAHELIAHGYENGKKAMLEQLTRPKVHPTRVPPPLEASILLAAWRHVLERDRKRKAGAAKKAAPAPEDLARQAVDLANALVEEAGLNTPAVGRD